MKQCRFICWFLMLSIFMGCAAISPHHSEFASKNSLPHPEFISKNVFDLRPGMTQKEIESRFGSPDRTSKMTMGTKTPEPWSSLIYYYDMRKDRIGRYKHIVYTNTFYFVLDIQPPLLRSWELELLYPDKIIK
ncbi:MAG: hypothetical protein P8012_04955 [Desulfobacterales bacterium]